MSAKNGDKSRFGRLRKERLLRRSHVLKLREELGKAAGKTAKSSPESGSASRARA